MSKRAWGRTGLIIMTIIWGTSFAINDIALVTFSPYQLLALRFGLAFILMATIFHKQLKHITKATLLKGTVMGLLLYTAYVFQTVALVYTTPSKNAFLTAFNVVLVPIIGLIVFKNKLKMKIIVGAIFSLTGVGIMSLNKLSNINLGDVLTLICALFFALQIIYTANYVKKENVFALNTIQMGMAAVCSILMVAFRSEPWNFADSTANISILYLGVFCTMIAFMLQTASQRYTTDSEAAIILSMESVFGMIFSVIIVNEVLTGRIILGAAFILLGVLIVELNLSSRRRKKKD